MAHIITGDLDDPKIIALLTFHLAQARAVTPVCHAHALDTSGLKQPDIRFFAMWEGETLRGVGALKALSAEHGEVKSMHTALAARRQGAGRAMLEHIIATAKAAGMRRLSLETGTHAYFEPAVRLYRRMGFVDCGPFGDYDASAHNMFLTREL